MTEDDNKSPYVIAYMACAFSGAFVGYLLGILTH